MKTYSDSTITTLLASQTTNGHGLHGKGITFKLEIEEPPFSSKGQPDRLLITIDGKRREIGYLSILPCGSMSVEDALLMWGEYSPRPDKCADVLSSIAELRAFRHRGFCTTIDHKAHLFFQ